MLAAAAAAAVIMGLLEDSTEELWSKVTIKQGQAGMKGKTSVPGRETHKNKPGLNPQWASINSCLPTIHSHSWTFLWGAIRFRI